MQEEDDAILKRSAAAYLGRKGGLARAKALTKAERIAAARLAVNARWKKHRKHARAHAA